jgi:alpha-tubulin suppressor-like RCC1 family protein
MNILNIIEVLAAKISASTSEQEILYFSKAIEKLRAGNLKTVATYLDMFDGSDNTGDVYFVEDEDSLYFSISTSRVLVLSTGIRAYAWGANSSGQLGDNSTTVRSSPVSVVGGFTNWTQLSASIGSNEHSLGLRADGLAYAWGNNISGQLGDGTTTSRSSPGLVVGGFRDWSQLSAGSSHSLGLRADGTAWAWGGNSSGTLGDGTAISKSSPVSVVGGFSDWTQLSAGAGFNLGLRANGTAWAWGINNSGQIGDNTTVSKSSPVSVVGGFTDWTQLSAGDSHSLGLRANGIAYAWGFNGSGQLGDDSITARSSPVSVVGGFTDWSQLNGGREHSVGLRANGSAWAWGLNTFGQLGDASLTSRRSPVSVVGGFSDWTQLSAGGYHSLGIRANGTAWAWGINNSGRLGDGTATSRLSPVSVVGGFTDWVQLSAGFSHSLAIKSIGV